MREAFAASSGISRVDGDLVVDKASAVKALSGEEILMQAVEETKYVAEEASVKTSRSSLAALTKVITKTSPSKHAPSEPNKAVAPTGTASSAKLAEKKQEMERQRNLRQAQVPGATTKPTVVAPPASSTKQPPTAQPSGTVSARPTAGKVSARPSATGLKTTMTKMPSTKVVEEEKKTVAPPSRRPAMTTPGPVGSAMKRSDSKSALESRTQASSTRASMVGGSPKRSAVPTEPRVTQQNSVRPAPSAKQTTAVRDKTPGPSAAPVTSKVTPMEIRKMENIVKDKEAEITRLSAQISALQQDKAALTKEKTEKEAAASKAVKEKTEMATRAQQEKEELEARSLREQEKIKKQMETKIAQLQKKIESQTQENQALQASVEDQASAERSKVNEDFDLKVVELESQIEELTIQMRTQELKLAEAKAAATQAETKLSD